MSAETIYRFIDSKADYALGLLLIPADRSAPESRAMERLAGHLISQKPDLLETDRSLAIGRATSSSSSVRSDMPMLHHLIERKSRFTVLIKNPSRHSRPIMDKIIRAFLSLPAFTRQSFTFDRGKEFAAFRDLEDGIGARSWFCDRFLPANTDPQPDVAGNT